MEKTNEMIKMNENSNFLNQLTASLEEASLKLEEAYNKEDYENFAKSKKLMLQIQKQINEMT